MSDHGPSAAPTPALPLEYFDRSSGPWVSVVRLMAWAGILHSGLTIASELSWVPVYAMQSFGRTSSLRLNFGYSIGAGFLPALNAIALLIGCIFSLQLSRGGRMSVLITSAGAIAFALLGIVIALVSVPFTRYPSAYRSMFFIQQLIGAFFTAAQHSVVPVLLWIVFRKREVREVFNAS